MAYKIASFISHFFAPFVLLPFFLFLVIAQSSYSIESKLISMGIINLVGILPIILMTVYLKYTKRISDWEMKSRNERHPVYLFSLIIGIVVIFLLHRIGASQLLQYLFIIIGWHAAMMVINFFWKISVHVGAVTIVTFLLLHLYGMNWWPLTIFIPLVAWSRVYRKNHTVLQVIGGFVLAGSFVWLAKQQGLV